MLSQPLVEEHMAQVQDLVERLDHDANWNEAARAILVLEAQALPALATALRADPQRRQDRVVDVIEVIAFQRAALRAALTLEQAQDVISPLVRRLADRWDQARQAARVLMIMAFPEATFPSGQQPLVQLQQPQQRQIGWGPDGVFDDLVTWMRRPGRRHCVAR
jgi:hypothetical protein